MNRQLVFTAWGTDWGLAACGAVVAALIFIFWSYRAHLNRPWAWVCGALKWLGIVLLAICLLEPAWVTQKADPGQNLFVVLADNSQSMNLHDAGSERSRGDQLLGELVPGHGSQAGATGDAPAWLEAMNETFAVRQYTLGDGLDRVEDWATGLRFDAERSALNSGLKTLGERLVGKPVAGVLLLTDGNATDTDDQVTASGGLGVPVYPVVVGHSAPPSDLAVGQVSVTQTVFEDAPVTAIVQARAIGFAGKPVTLQWLDQAGTVVAEQTQTPEADDQAMAFRLTHRPLTGELGFYQLNILSKGEVGDESEAEATLANNTKPIVVQPQGGPYRVLYVGGRPNWEYKFLSRALAEDEAVNMSALMRVAKREAKFAWRGRAGESTNPLFRGFDRADDATEQFDEPVVIRLNVRDEDELREGFPKTAEGLYPYHAVIFDDVEASFLTPAQQVLLKRFVTQRGGGLMMLAGQESFDLGGYDRTPVADVLPVYVNKSLSDADAVSQWHGPYRLELTRQGLLEPWTRLADQVAGERLTRESMPEFRSVNRLASIKPGAQVMASLIDESTGAQWPGVVVQRSGRGRSLAVLMGDFWRWQLTDNDADAKLGKSWRQAVRWLVSDVPEPVTIRPPKNLAMVNEPVTLSVSVLGEDFERRDDAVVRLAVESMAAASTQANAQVVELMAEASTQAAGLYEARYLPRRQGGYRVTAHVSDLKGALIQSRQMGFVVNGAEQEFSTLSPNADAMQALAKATGGEVIPMDGLQAFVDRLPTLASPNMVTQTTPLWHQPYLFVLALVCLMIEWVLRRRKGLA